MSANPFPTQFFPDTFVPILEEVAYCNRFHMDYLCASVLSVAATAIGNSHAIVVKDTWIERPSLWIAIVGVPGVAKSHPLSWAMSPLHKREKFLFREFKDRVNEWQRDPEKETKPKPELVKTVIGDTTPEAVAHQLSINPRGVMIHNDELAAFINSFQRYNKGNDEQFYLTVFNGSPIIIDRKTQLPVRINEPVVNINGTIQPAVMERLFKDKEESGFTDRWLICNPPDVKKEYWTDDVVSLSTTEAYHRLMYTIMDLDMSHSVSDEPTSHKVEYSPEGIATIHRWHRANTDEINKAESDAVKAVRAKMETYIHRFALVAAVMDHCWNARPFGPASVDRIHAERACLLADYFLSNMIRMREGDKAEQLPMPWREIYDALPVDEVEFKLGDFVDWAVRANVKEETARTWFKRQEGKLFKKVGHGRYYKI